MHFITYLRKNSLCTSVTGITGNLYPQVRLCCNTNTKFSAKFFSSIFKKNNLIYLFWSFFASCFEDILSKITNFLRAVKTNAIVFEILAINYITSGQIFAKILNFLVFNVN